MKPLATCWLGRVDYRAGLRLQDLLLAGRRECTIPDTLVLLEHPPVITLGRGGNAANVLADATQLRRKGIEIHQTGRGGDVTYHGPGQLVGYPVIKLEDDEKDAHAYLRRLEQALIEIAAAFGVVAVRSEGLTGIWVGREKLAAIGVRLSTGWITSHGFALNVTTNLRDFSTIVPCGIHDRGVTSFRNLLGRDLALTDVARVAADCVARTMNRRAGALELAPALPSGVSWEPISLTSKGDRP